MDAIKLVNVYLRVFVADRAIFLLFLFLFFFRMLSLRGREREEGEEEEGCKLMLYLNRLFDTFAVRFYFF